MAAGALAAAHTPEQETHGPVWNAVHLHQSLPEKELLAPDKPAAPVPYLALRHDVQATFFYGLRTSGNDAYTCNIYGLEVEYARYLSRHHALTLTASVGSGSKDYGRWAEGDGAAIPFTNNYQRTSLCFMAGWRTSVYLSPRLLLSAGIKVGADFQMLNVDYGRDWTKEPKPDHDIQPNYHPDTDSWEYDDDETANKRKTYGNEHSKLGFAYAASVTLSYRITKNTGLTAGYTFRSTNAAPDAEPGQAAEPPRVRSSAIGWHEFHLGLSLSF